MFLFRYSRWDGSQEIFPLDAEGLMEELSRHLMGRGDMSSALRALIQQGIPDRLPGIQDLLKRLREQRRHILDRFQLDSLLEGTKERLHRVLDLERQGIRRRLEEVQQRYQRLQEEGALSSLEEELLKMMERMATRNRETLDRLPPELGKAIRRLMDYEFMDPEARAEFKELVRSLQQKMVGHYLGRLAQQLQGLTSQDRALLTEMLRDLNRLLEEKIRGGEPQFQSFRKRYRELLGPRPPATLDELLEHVERSVAQMESLLKSLSPQKRQELRELMESLLQDEELKQEISCLAQNLDRVSPRHRLLRQYQFQGDEPVTLEEALHLVEQLQNMDRLEQQLKRDQYGGMPGQVDHDLLREVLGEEACQEWQQLKGITEMLKEAGYLKQVGTQLELTPKGIRKIGQKALGEIFALIKKDRMGPHPTGARGRGSDPTEGTKPYEFGDPFLLDLKGSLMNALRRNRPGLPIRMQPGDLEVYQTEQVSLSATVLMLDLSLSMAMRGNFLAAKRVALALESLIRTQFPKDAFYIVGFSTYAREVKPHQLPYLTWDEFEPYTNIQHGLALARQLLSRAPGGTKQIILISDGEPTAHIEKGRLFLQYPPSPRTLHETLQEVKRCTQKDIVINTFMLERNSYLVEFVDHLTRINGGRVFYTSAEKLGQYLLVDYLSHRRRLLG